jgi:hypothetical protein
VKELTEAQLKLICDFLNMTAAAWFSAGIITPFFTLKNSSEKITFSLAGITAAFLFFSVALIYAKRMK